jgi:hypothetical protein
MAGRPFTLKSRRRSREADGQKFVVQQLRSYLPDEVWWTVSLSGIRLPPHIAAEAKRLGMQKGAPDFSFVFPDGLTRYVDLKTTTGSLTPEQAALQAVVGEESFKVVTVYSLALDKTWREFRAALAPWMAANGLSLLSEAEALKRHQRRLQAAQFAKRSAA